VFVTEAFSLGATVLHCTPLYSTLVILPSASFVVIFTSSINPLTWVCGKELALYGCNQHSTCQHKKSSKLCD
jgi:hypothetical protein